MKTDDYKCINCKNEIKIGEMTHNVDWEMYQNDKSGEVQVHHVASITLCDVCKDYVFEGECKMSEHKLNAIVIKQKYSIGGDLN